MTHARTHVHTHMVQIITSRRRARREIIIKNESALILTQGNLLVVWYSSTCMQNKREIIAIVNEKISDLVYDFMNFNTLKIIKKFIKKIKIDPGLIVTQGNLLVA